MRFTVNRSEEIRTLVKMIDVNLCALTNKKNIDVKNYNLLLWFYEQVADLTERQTKDEEAIDLLTNWVEEYRKKENYDYDLAMEIKDIINQLR